MTGVAASGALGAATSIFSFVTSAGLAASVSASVAAAGESGQGALHEKLSSVRTHPPSWAC